MCNTLNNITSSSESSPNTEGRAKKLDLEDLFWGNMSPYLQKERKVKKTNKQTIHDPKYHTFGCNETCSGFVIHSSPPVFFNPGFSRFCCTHMTVFTAYNTLDPTNQLFDYLNVF